MTFIIALHDSKGDHKDTVPPRATILALKANITETCSICLFNGDIGLYLQNLAHG